jgi:hypothetical protein
MHSLEDFLGSMGSLTSPHKLRIRPQAHDARIYQHATLHPCPGTTTTRDKLPSCVTPSLQTHTSGYGNINPSSIDYA